LEGGNVRPPHCYVAATIMLRQLGVLETSRPRSGLDRQLTTDN
jgi:hypothetical protein